MPLGENMRAWRTELDWTQEESARRAGLKLNTWVRTELGLTQPTLATLQAIAAVFDVTLDALLDDDDEHRPAGAA